MFAFHQAKVKPDIVCIGKGLTGGIISLSATVSTKNFQCIFRKKENIEFMHGPTYMANPLACSAANATLDYMKKNKILNKVKIEKYFSDNLTKFHKYSFVSSTRYIGAIVIELIDINKKQLKWLRNEYIKKEVYGQDL